MRKSEEEYLLVHKLRSSSEIKILNVPYMILTRLYILPFKVCGNIFGEVTKISWLIWWQIIKVGVPNIPQNSFFRFSLSFFPVTFRKMSDSQEEGFHRNIANRQYKRKKSIQNCDIIATMVRKDLDLLASK